MRPLAIDIQGFTAFRELQEVDLRGLQLFVITGPTGAGKTSLLDAMIFALYGKVPRAGAQSVRDLVSHGVAESRVRLEFELDGERYQIARRLPRNGAQSATLERFEGDGWRSAVDGGGVRHVNECIERLLKLPFDAFTRAVVLPQGEFHRFLTGERDGRRQILTQLLGLGHYAEMGRRARNRAMELRTKIETTQTIIDDQYGDATEEEQARLDGLAEEAEARATALQAELKKAQKVGIERDRLTVALQALAQRAVDVRELDGEVAQAKDAYAEAQEREKELADALATTTAALDTAQAELGRYRKHLEDAIARCGTLEGIARAEAALERVAKADSEYEGWSDERERAAGELNTLIELAAAAETELKLAQERLAAAAEAQTNARELSAGADEDARAAEVRVAAIGEAQERHQQAEAAEAGSRERLRSAELAYQLAAQALAADEGAVRTLERSHSAAVAAAGLQPGDACPVCERPLEEHPRADDAAEELGRARANLDASRVLARDADRELAAAQEGAQVAEALLRSATDELSKLLAERTIDAIRAEAEHSRASAADGRTALEAAESELAQARGAVGTAESGSVQARADVEAHERLLALAADRLATAEQDKRDAAAVLATHFGDEQPSDAAGELAAQREEVQAASAAVANATDEAERERDERDDLGRRLEDVRKELSGADTTISALHARCEVLGDQTTEVLRTVADDLAMPGLEPAPTERDVHVVVLRKWCSEGAELVDTAVQSGEAKDGQLLVSLERICADNELSVAGDPMSAISVAADAATEDRGVARQAAKDMATRLGQRFELVAKIAADAEQAELYEALSAELRNDRFVAFILQETFDLLAIRASEELLRISDERYSLISANGEFEVVDHANADETRGVNTLSGGETFLASLALALALSRHVGDLAAEGMGAKLQTVFIDEGFGTLDPETLEDVVDALERLRDGDLLVGVISHVPLLSERIRAGLTVEKAGGWSTIKAAHE
jgi:exonuclease SbcC